ncbi:MAG: hypothetical protein ACOC33_00840 [bacterium]
MRSVSLFIENLEPQNTSMSPGENWRKIEDEKAREAFRQGKISQEQLQKHMVQTKQMSDEPGNVAKAGLMVFGQSSMNDPEQDLKEDPNQNKKTNQQQAQTK